MIEILLLIIVVILLIVFFPILIANLLFFISIPIIFIFQHWQIIAAIIFASMCFLALIRYISKPSSEHAKSNKKFAQGEGKAKLLGKHVFNAHLIDADRPDPPIGASLESGEFWNSFSRQTEIQTYYRDRDGNRVLVRSNSKII